MQSLFLHDLKKSTLKYLLVSFLLLISWLAQAQSEKDGLLDNLYYLISNETKDSLQRHDQNKIRKNAISLQLLGDTPYLGMKYSRRLYQSKDLKNLLEAGLGIGFAPRFFQEDPADFSFSHHTSWVFRSDKLVSPFISYSGVFYSGEFYKEKLFNYLPAPSLGLRFGKTDKVAVNLYWQGFFYHNYRYEIAEGDLLHVYRQDKLMSVFGLNLMLPFK